jgi:hypothetical protein
MYCLKCCKNVKDEAAEKCPDCGTPLHEKISAEERTPLVQTLHRKANKVSDRTNSAMSFLVLGLIFVVIGIIFFSLAYKLDPNNTADNNRHLMVNSLEFFVSMASLIGGGLASLYGLIMVIIDTRILRVLNHDIDAINRSLDVKVPSTPLWITEFVQKTKVTLANRKAIRAAEKSKKNS